MFKSIRYAHIALRVSLALVFLWFGFDAFVHPDYWANAWVPGWAMDLLVRLGITSLTLVYALASFEILVGISLISGMFIRVFSALAIMFLIGVLTSFGLNEILIRDIGVVGGLVALFLWPDRRGLSSWD